jgi:hypothetical protein
MSDDATVNAAKEVAAQAAFEAYSTTLVRELRDQGLALASLPGTRHVRRALLVDDVGTGSSVLVEAVWTFSAVGVG